MKRTLMIGIIVLSSFFGNAQYFAEKGIIWSEGNTWSQIIEKAKKDNKCIFLDCYATWCMPCHAMDKAVFANDTVSAFINGRFISVKVQMDKTMNDNDEIKKWYVQAGIIERNYSVRALPTFLFFSPDGSPLHKAVGYKSPSEFIAVAKDALDSSKQFYSVLKNYSPGKIDTSEMKGLARAFKNSGGNLAQKIAEDYLQRIPKNEIGNPDNLTFMDEFQQDTNVLNYAVGYLEKLSRKQFAKRKNIDFLKGLKNQPRIQAIVLKYVSDLSHSQLHEPQNLEILVAFKKVNQIHNISISFLERLPEQKFYTRKNIAFASSVITSADEKFTDLFYKNSYVIDSIMMRSDYSRNFIDGLIIDRYVNPVIIATKEGETPNFDSVYTLINNRFENDFAERSILKGKVAFYGYRAKKYNMEWDRYIQFSIDLIDKYGTDTTNVFTDALVLNNTSYGVIFLHSEDTSQIKTAIKWMEGVIRRHPDDANYRDTYANLIYKLGKNNEAIKLEEEALDIAYVRKQDWCIPSITKNLAKMKANIPTWTSK